MSVREDIKILLVKENRKLVEVAEKLSAKKNTKITADNLSQKLRKGTLRYDDAKLIAEILGYRIKFDKNK